MLAGAPDGSNVGQHIGSFNLETSINDMRQSSVVKLCALQEAKLRKDNANNARTRELRRKGSAFDRTFTAANHNGACRSKRSNMRRVISKTAYDSTVEHET